jgi:hypothetical protein
MTPLQNFNRQILMNFGTDIEGDSSFELLNYDCLQKHNGGS